MPKGCAQIASTKSMPRTQEPVSEFVMNSFTYVQDVDSKWELMIYF